MSKQSGLGDRLFVAGFDLSGDIGSLERIGGGPAALEMTGIDKEAMERLGGVRDGGIDFASFFNKATGQAHPTLSALPTADEVVSYFRGTTLGNAAASIVAKQIGYDGSRGEDGSLTFKTSALANGFGLEWGRQLTAGKRTDTGATDGTGVDFAAAGTNGLQAYLHVFSFTGTDATIKLQSSSDDAVADPYADVTSGAFAEITIGPTSERIALTGNVEEWLRVATVTTGGFTELTFAVMVVFNETAVSF